MEPVGGGSLAFRARDSILASILAHRFEDGRLPPENELADMLGVSRTTVRAALQSLEQHGVLTRSPRRGTQIHDRMSPAMVALQRLIGFRRLLEEQGYVVELQTKVTRTHDLPTEVGSALGLPEDTECYQIDRHLFASGEPAVWAIDYFPCSLFRRDPGPDLLASSPFEMGDVLIGGPIDHALVELVPRKATREVAERLGLKQSEAYLLLREIHFSSEASTLAFSLIHVNDRFVRFQLHRGRGL